MKTVRLTACAVILALAALLLAAYLGRGSRNDLTRPLRDARIVVLKSSTAR